MDEDELVARAQAGEEAAWLALVDAHGQAVFRLAYLLTANADDAADVAQETLLRAYRHIAQFERGHPLRPWLLRIARNQAYNWRRSLRRFQAALTRLQIRTVSGPVAPEVGDQTDVWEALRRLDQKDREVIYVRYFLDLSVAETALALDIPEGTVKSRLARALVRLRVLLVQHDPDLASEAKS